MILISGFYFLPRSGNCRGFVTFLNWILGHDLYGLRGL